MSLKEFLENLEIGEEKIKLSKDDIKNIMAESGKVVETEKTKVEDNYKKDIDEYKSTIDDLKSQIEKSPKSEELENLKNTIADMEAKEQKRIADEKARKDDEILTKNIVEAFGDKKFINEYTKNAIINDIKNGLRDEKNGGKSAKDLFEEYTKDKSDIFANPNSMPDMAGMGNDDGVSNNLNVGEIKLNPMFKNYNN